MWDFIVNILKFTGIEDKSVWQDIFISVLLIPVSIWLFNKFLHWWNNQRPSRLIFKDYLKNGNSDIFIFHSQMSGADENHVINKDQKYVTRYPDPTPTDNAHLGVQRKGNIDPVLSVAESGCVAAVYNVLGTVGKIRNVKVGDLINDWGIWSAPIFSVGFNPKTKKLIERCEPVYFEVNRANTELKMKNNANVKYDCVRPNDAGIIQKSFSKDTRKSPIFILAGLGTPGTSAAGHILKQYFVDFGKLFGNKPFCAFIKANISEGKTSALLDKIYPKPLWRRILLHPLVYHRFKKMKFFDYR